MPPPPGWGAGARLRGACVRASEVASEHVRAQRHEDGLPSGTCLATSPPLLEEVTPGERPPPELPVGPGFWVKRASAGRGPFPLVEVAPPRGAAGLGRQKGTRGDVPKFGRG